MSCEVRAESSATVVRLAGELDLSTTRTVHTFLDRCLDRQPDALIVDLADVRVLDPLALSIFVAVARQADGWPGVPLVLCSLPKQTADWLAGSTTCQAVPVRRDCATATREAGVKAAPRLRARFQPVADACRRGRELAVDACQRWNLPELAGPVSLVVSELVGNVVRHAGTPMEVRLTLRRPYLHVAVLDGSREVARPGVPGLRSEGGRGLMLVRELTQRWGSAPTGDGKVVWAMLPAT